MTLSLGKVDYCYPIEGITAIVRDTAAFDGDDDTTLSDDTGESSHGDARLEVCFECAQDACALLWSSRERQDGRLSVN